MPKASTQSFLEVERIERGIVYLKDKSMHAVLMVSSLNFALKSIEEQEATIVQFQNFLNSLDFPIQIVVQSRRLNLTGYLERLEAMEKAQSNELLKRLMSEYRKFVGNLVEQGQIFTKNFFVIVPFYPFEIPGVKKGEELRKEKLERAKIQLLQRVEFVALGLRRCGLEVALLGTPELVELYWSWHHPEEAEKGYFPEVPPEFLT
jgi:type IV secretory pathway VirB4 component